MHALLIHPQFPDTFWSFKYALRFIGKKASLPPLGLLTIAGMLPPDWDLRLVDTNVRRLKKRHLAWADIVFVGAMTIQRPSARQIVDRCRQAGIPVVCGGPLFSCEPDQFPQVDHLLLGECEATMPRFLADLAAGKPRPVYRADHFPDLAQTPLPRWDLAELKKYASMSIQYSRGCPYDCEFCNVTSLFGQKPRIKATPRILAELDALVSCGWKGSVFFVDDNFIGNRKRLKTDLLPALADWQAKHPGMPFFTEASIDLADDPELLQLMVKAGFDMVFIGIETPDAEALKECLKRQNLNRDMAADIRKIQAAGIQVQGGFIVGFDSDTPTIFARQFEFIQKSGVVTAMVGMLEAMPGTRLHERLKKEQRLRDESTSGDNVDGDTNIVPVMGLDTLRDGYRQLMARIYAPRQYYRRVKTFLEQYRAPETTMPLDRQRWVAFQRSIVRLGILGRERWQYWRLLTWTLFHRPRLISLAVSLSICGFHFRKMCQHHLK